MHQDPAWIGGRHAWFAAPNQIGTVGVPVSEFDHGMSCVSVADLKVKWATRKPGSMFRQSLARYMYAELVHQREKSRMSSTHCSIAQRLISLLLFTGGILAGGVCHAQFLSAPQVLSESKFDYKTDVPAVSIPTFLAQSNAEGALHFAFIGDNAFGDNSAPYVAIYGRALSQPTIKSYQAFDRSASVAAFVTQLNAEAALGYRFFGDQIYDLVASSIYVSENNGYTYHYKIQAPAADVVAFLALINSEGALGYQFQGNVIFDDGASNFIVSSLFSRNTAAPTTYSYEAAPMVEDAAALVVQANNQGLRKFIYRGGIVFGSLEFVTYSLYEKDNLRADTFRYEQLARSNSTAAFLIQANAEGARRFRYFGEVGFASGQFASLYAGVAPIFAGGFEN